MQEQLLGVHPGLDIAEDCRVLEVVEVDGLGLAFEELAVEGGFENGGVVGGDFKVDQVGGEIGAEADVDGAYCEGFTGLPLLVFDIAYFGV